MSDGTWKFSEAAHPFSSTAMVRFKDGVASFFRRADVSDQVMSSKKAAQAREGRGRPTEWHKRTEKYMKGEK